MDKQAMWKWLLLIGLVAWSLVLVTPLTDVFNEQGELVKPGKIKLGLDLRGGTSFVLEVDTSELEGAAKQSARERALEIIRNRVDGMGVSEPIIYPEPKSDRIVVQIPGLKESDRNRAVKAIRQQAFLEFRIVHENNDQLVDEVFNRELAPEGFKIVNIPEQLPNGQWTDVKYYKRTDAGELDLDYRDRIATFQAPPRYEFLLQEIEKQDQTLYRPFFVRIQSRGSKDALTGEYIKSAGIDYDEFMQARVTLTFDSRGKRIFGRLTSDYAPGGARNPNPEGRRYLAIVLDGKLYSAPFVKTAILGGNAIIEGGFSVPEAQDLAIVLQAGSLPTPVSVVEERGVDPTLGRDSINSGIRAALLGGIAVIAFMLIYYLLAGVVANVALALDILLLPLGMMIASGFLSLLTGSSHMLGGTIELPTLTLPGIAGIILTIGMAVDANVLIFERIREEHQAGKSLGPAVSAGYDKAFSTILDANVTTLLTAVILFWQGSGPVRGFAVTLSAGILVSMYTALVVTRMLFNQISERTGLKTIKMLRLVGETSIDFIGKRWIAAALSVALIVGSWIVFFQKGDDNFGVDFTGGSALTFQFEERVPVSDVRDALQAAGVEDVFIQYQRVVSADDPSEFTEYLEIKTGFEQGDAAKQALTQAFSDQAFKAVKADSVGPQIGKELKRKGLIAIGAALIGIVIYITLRFEFAFAVAAIVALLHDVLITVGIFCLLDNQLSLPIIAALLTIVGYSVNDTIVVFDRIREDLKLFKGRSYKDICNISINQTLARTLLTSLTTLLSVTMLLIFGGGAIHDFALALFIGVMVGTYSSIFVATPVVLLWHRDKKKKAGA